MAKKSSFNYKKTVRNINKVTKALGGTSKKTTRSKSKTNQKNTGLTNISSTPQIENTGCLIPILLVSSIPLAINLFI